MPPHTVITPLASEQLRSQGVEIGHEEQEPAVSNPAGRIGVAQDRPTVTAQPNTIFVGADGKFEANPDTALVQFNISAQEESSRAAYDRASKAGEQIRQNVAGIAPLHGLTLTGHEFQQLTDGVRRGVKR